MVLINELIIICKSFIKFVCRFHICLTIYRLYIYDRDYDWTTTTTRFIHSHRLKVIMNSLRHLFINLSGQYEFIIRMLSPIFEYIAVQYWKQVRCKLNITHNRTEQTPPIVGHTIIGLNTK